MSNMVKWNPFKELAEMTNSFTRLDPLFDTFGELFKFSDRGFKMDIWENESSINVKAEVPGVNKDDIAIEYNDAILTITVTQKEEKIDQDSARKYYRKEISNKSFARQIHAPNIQVDKVEASHENGFLTITIPKIPDVKPAVKKIEIK